MEALFLIQEDHWENLEKAFINYKKSPKSRITQSYAETKLENLEQLFDRFYSTHTKIVGAVTKEQKVKYKYFEKDIYNVFEEMYLEYKTKLKEDLKRLNLNPKPSAIIDVPTQNEIKLPQINLPTFQGSYEEWQSFHDMFNSLIHINKNINPVQKLHYLKGCLMGEPAKLIANLKITENNYEEAWNQLKRRYNNIRYNLNETMKRLFAQKTIGNESATSIKQILDNTSSCLKALNNLKINTDSWDPIIIYLVTTKLDNESRKLWESNLNKENTDDLPKWEDLVKFLEYRFRTLEMMEENKQFKPTSLKGKVYHCKVEDKIQDTKIYTCVYCNKQHLLYQCEQFQRQTPQQRAIFIESKGLCFNCFASTHNVKNCHRSTCCRRCGRRHHTLLHIERTTIPGQSTVKQDNNAISRQEPTNLKIDKKVLAHCASNKMSDVLLATAVAKIVNSAGYSQLVRLLIDQGSEASFITENVVQRLGLSKIPVNGLVSGVGDKDINIKSKVIFNIDSIHNPKYSVQVQAFVLSTLTSFLPTNRIVVNEWSDLKNLPLADPQYGEPGRIDMILGVEIYGEIILHGLLKHPSYSSGPVAQNTQLGWVLSGRIQNPITTKTKRVVNLHIRAKEDELLKKFWEVEREPNEIYKKMTREEKKCEEIFKETTVREIDGRYKVRLPFKDPEPKCRNNNLRNIALHRFDLLEKKFKKDEELKVEYTRAIEDYINQNHMEEITDIEEINNPNAVYLPHHAVVKKDRQTTKVRIVYDASCKGKNNISLNDTLLVGPKLQQDLRHILMRWRCYYYCIVADLCQMYRQVLVHEEDRDYQRIYWRGTNGDLKHYRMNRLTFGTSCAPYLAVKSLHQLAIDEQNNYPVAASITLKDYYMDDLLTTCENENDAVTIYNEMNSLMNSGGYKLQKWSTNSEELIKYINEGNKNKNDTVVFKTDDIFKILGIFWNKVTDTFEYSYEINESKDPITKRKVLSEISRLYDPLGWIAPVIVNFKIFMQKLWKSNLNWDEVLTKNLLNEWLSYKKDLSNVKRIKIPRWLKYKTSCTRELHVFADASNSSYAAVVYMKVVDNNQNVFVNLISSKTKVSPIEKELSIPRLELCAALLATKLIYEVSVVMEISKSNLFAWSDSTVTLAWIKGEPSKWNTFVSNRVSEILTMLNSDQWNHVSTDQNPADPASRGLSSSEIVNLRLWWHGPEFLTKQNNYEKNYEEFITREEIRSIKSFAASIKPTEDFIWLRFSNFNKMLKILSYCRRILKRNKVDIEKSKIITKEEIEEVTKITIKATQNLYFKEEIKLLTNQNNINKRSPLYSLDPFLDQNGIVRVGGRIANAQESYDKKHPIILPFESHLTKLIVLNTHLKTLHGGPQVMLNYLRSKFWIIRGRILVKKTYRECVTCIRYGKQKNNALMGQLPTTRITPSRPFKNSGVDFTGHINIRFSPGRGSKSYKGYICIFICMVTRAVHLEAVSDLTSKGFIAAYRRFVSRRGHCQNLYSDNGTNFVGATKELQSMHKLSISQLPDDYKQLLTSEGTSWHFIPPHAPNFGGLWEAGVRCTKNHLKKILGDSTLTFEELSTVLTQIEACLNSRPISYISDNPIDPLPLTPGHFLVGEPLISVPDKDHSIDNTCSLSNRWVMCQRMVNSFWNKWSKEYLTTLSNRYKWSTKGDEPKVGDVVIIREDNLPPAKWLLAKIVSLHPGQDNVTRVVTVKTKIGTLKRPLNKVCILEKE